MENQLNFHTQIKICCFLRPHSAIWSSGGWWRVVKGEGCWDEWACPCPVVHLWAPLLTAPPVPRAGGDILGRWLKVLPTREGTDNLPSSASFSTMSDGTWGEPVPWCWLFMLLPHHLFLCKKLRSLCIVFLKCYYGDVLKSLMEDVTSGMASGKES